MRIDPVRSAVTVCALLWTGAALAQDHDIESLRNAIEELRSEYENRISELERRLAVAEQNARQANAAAQQSAAASPASGSGQAAFNPSIGVIFSGTAWDFSNAAEDNPVAGFPFGGEAGPIDQGLALGETEIDISANVDDKFTAWLTLPVALEDGEVKVELEEAWIETTALPAGFSARFGRFFSGIGYLNEKHLHTWDFADQPLPYQAFLGSQYIDDGVQLRWIAPTPLYVELGSEIMRGGAYPAAGADNSGVGSYSLFANIGGDVGTENSWLAGISHLEASAADRPSGPEDDPAIFSGDAAVTAAHFVWKWAADGNWRQQNLVLQSELLWKNDDGEYALPAGPTQPFDNEQFGWYLQAVYQPFPRWRFGARVDGLSSDDPGPLFEATLLEPLAGDPRRYSVMMDWSNSEFSRLRLQFTRDMASLDEGHQWGVQYIHSIGAHGAHSF
jgi:hypothetical protein